MSAPYLPSPWERLHRSSLVETDVDGGPVIWIGHDELAVCMNPTLDRIYASVWHDGCEKYFPTLFVPMRLVDRIRSEQLVVGEKLCRSLRVRLEILRLKCSGMPEAKTIVEAYLIDLGLIRPRN